MEVYMPEQPLQGMQGTVVTADFKKLCNFYENQTTVLAWQVPIEAGVKQPGAVHFHSCTLRIFEP